MDQHTSTPARATAHEVRDLLRLSIDLHEGERREAAASTTNNNATLPHFLDFRRDIVDRTRQRILYGLQGTCITCQTDIPAEDLNLDVLVTPCEHLFHSDGLGKWHNSSNANRNTCPLCRTKLFRMNAPTPASVQPVQGEAMAAVRARLRGMVEAAELQNMAADEEHNNQPQPPENPSQARATPGYANLPVAGMNLGIASPVSVDDIDVLRENVSSDDSDSDSDFVEEIASRASVNAEGEQDDGMTMNDQDNESWPDALFQGGRRLSSRRHHDGQLSWSEPNNPIVDLMDPGEVNAINTGTREDSVNTLSMERPVLNEDSSLVPNPPNIAGSPDIVDEGYRDGEDALLARVDQAPRRRHQARRNTQARRDRPRSVFHGRAVNSTEVIRRIRARRERSAASRRLRALNNNVNGATDTSDSETVDVEVQQNNDPRVVRNSHITPSLAPIPAFAGGYAAAPLYPLTIRPDATAGPERPPWIRQHPPEGIRPSRPRYEPRSQLGMRHRSTTFHVDPVPIYAPTPAPVPALPPAPAPARNEISGQGPGYYITELQIQRARSDIMLSYHYVGEFANVEAIRSDDDHQVVLQRHPDGLVEVRVRADGHTMIGNHAIFFRFRR